MSAPAGLTGSLPSVGVSRGRKEHVSLACSCHSWQRIQVRVAGQAPRLLRGPSLDRPRAAGS